jgi:Bacteriophage holin family, superfamily II-like
MALKSFEVPEATVDSAVSSVASKMTLLGGAGGIVGFLSSSAGIAITGMVFAALGLAVNWWFKRAEDRRQQEEHDFRTALAKREEERREEIHRAQMAALEKATD